MTAPACPELAAELYEQVLASTDSVGDAGVELFYLLGAILNGGWVDFSFAIQPETITLINALPYKDAFLMYCTPTRFTLDDVTAARVAAKLLS